MSIYTIGFVYPEDFTHDFRCYVTLTNEHGKTIYSNWRHQVFNVGRMSDLELLAKIEVYKQSEIRNFLRYVSETAYGRINVYDTCVFRTTYDKPSRSLQISPSDKFIFLSKDVYDPNRIQLIASSVCSSNIPNLLEGL